MLQLASAWLGNPREDHEVLAWLMMRTLAEPVERRAAVLDWPKRRDARVRVPLLVALHDPDADVRDAAMYGLRHFPDSAHVEPLIATFLAEKTWRRSVSP